MRPRAVSDLPGQSGAAAYRRLDAFDGFDFFDFFDFWGGAAFRLFGGAFFGPAARLAALAALAGALRRGARRAGTAAGAGTTAGRAWRG